MLHGHGGKGWIRTNDTHPVKDVALNIHVTTDTRQYWPTELPRRKLSKINVTFYQVYISLGNSIFEKKFEFFLSNTTCYFRPLAEWKKVARWGHGNLLTGHGKVRSTELR